MFGGKTAYLNRLYSRAQFKPITLGTHMEGASPPSVFIGRMGYPKVSVGPLMTVEHGDTSVMDMPEQWLAGKSHNKLTHEVRLTAVDIINFRLQMVRGTTPAKIKDQNKTTDMLKDIALSKHSVEIEADFSRMPQGRFLHEEVQPFGPSGPIKNVKANVGKYEPHMEKAFSDTDLLSKDAVIWLYKKDLPFSTIQKAFSTGAFGLAKNRKLVPTRWSITAVDDMLGLDLLEKIRAYPIIDRYEVYEAEAFRNKFIIILIPTHWQYEFLEAFIDVFDKEKMLFADSEGYEKRKKYSEVGGCYYSTRLAVAEKLEGMKRQAGVLVFRESYQGYIPLGVWLVRESAREAMKKKPAGFQDFRSCLTYAYGRLKLPVNRYWKESSFLKRPELFKTLKA